MGKEHQKQKKTLIGIGELDYVEVKNVPMSHYTEFGDAVHSKVLAEIEKMVARELILERFHIRGKEITFFRNIFALSQRQFAEHLHLSHVSILKWEKAKNKPLDLVNEVAVKAFISGKLGLKVRASLETLAGKQNIPKKLVLDYSDSDLKEDAA